MKKPNLKRKKQSEEKDAESDSNIRRTASTWNENVIERLPVKNGAKWKKVVQVSNNESSTQNVTMQEQSEAANDESSATAAQKEEKPATEAAPVLSESEMKMQIGICATKILEDPNEHFDKLKRLLAFVLPAGSDGKGKKGSRNNLPAAPVTGSFEIQRLAMISLMAVFKDIIPGYRIRPLTELEQKEKVSKEVKQLRSFEQGILTHYFTFLKHLEDIVLDEGSKFPSSLKRASITVLCTLLVDLSHFNFRKNICLIVVNNSINEDLKIANHCVDALKQLFDADECGEASFEAVQFISRLMKQTPITKGIMGQTQGLLDSLSHLKLRDEFLSVNEAADEELKQEKHQKKHHISKRGKKKLKEEKEAEKELKEAMAVFSAQEKKRWYKESLKLVFIIYFRILKKMAESPLLTPVLEGLSRFSHLIDVSVFHDLMQCLQKLTSNSSQSFQLAPASLLQAILTVSNLSVMYGQAVTASQMGVDFRHFNRLFYNTILFLAAGSSSSEEKKVEKKIKKGKTVIQRNNNVVKSPYLFEKHFIPSAEQIGQLIMTLCHVLFWKRGEQPANRLACFCHALIALTNRIVQYLGVGEEVNSTLEKIALNLLNLTYSLMEKYPKLQNLLLDDSETTSLLAPAAVNTSCRNSNSNSKFDSIQQADPDLENGFAKSLSIEWPPYATSPQSNWHILWQKYQMLEKHIKLLN